jgi:hypothetical protein
MFACGCLTVTKAQTVPFGSTGFGSGQLGRDDGTNLNLETTTGDRDLRMSSSSGSTYGIYTIGKTGYYEWFANGVQRMYLTPSGLLGVGTATPDEKLTVAGKIHSQEVKVTATAGADFVFHKDYSLPGLTEVEKYVREKQHLPGIAPAKEMVANGIELGEMNIKLLQKIEELTLYLIDQKKEIGDLQKRIATLEKK